MFNKIKKILLFFLIFTMLTIPVNSSADIVGSVLTTDIKVYIDQFLVPSYNIDGYTAVLLRDLENYGFTVVWDENTKTVDFYKDFSKPCEPMLPTYSSLKVGTKMYDVLSTDIKVFYRGVEIPAYNIDGRTAVRVRDISLVGSAVYDEKNKTVDAACSETEFYDDEKEYFRSHFYKNLLILAQADFNHQILVPMIDSGKYDKKKVAEFDKFDQIMRDSFDRFKDYKEPYGFSSSAMELWWAMVNMRLASDCLLDMSEKIKNNEDITELRKQYDTYRFDSLEQRRVSLLKLNDDIINITCTWD